VILRHSCAVVAAAVVVFAICAIATTAAAHPEGFSGLRVKVDATAVHAVVTVHTRDTSQWFPPGKYKDYVADVCRALEATPGDALEVQFDGVPAAPVHVHAFAADVGLLELDLDYARPAGAATMTLWSKHLVRLPRGHQQILVVESADGEGLLEDTLSSDHALAEVELPVAKSATSAPTTIASTAPTTRHTDRPRISFFALGIEHIVTGYDHLLFLAALLLVCKNFREAAGVITFFTVAHTITLSLAALNIVRMPARIVEPAIAASIVYVGLENLFGKHRFAWRAGITFAFGLVHGLGFASALREVGLGSTSLRIAMPLLKFSIGLETGQLCIAAVILQVMLLLRRNRPEFVRWWVPAGSVLVAGIGCFWLVTRVLSG
jgi:hydrogenase/urease accessory protein HupE